MKRLVKKSEIFNGTNFTIFNEEKYYEIFKNPTYKEIQEIRYQDSHKSVRGLVKENGDVYVWAADIWHDKIKQLVNLNTASSLRIECPNDWLLDVDGQKMYYDDEICEIFKKCKNVITNMFGLGENDICVVITDVPSDELGQCTLKELLEYNDDIYIGR